MCMSTLVYVLLLTDWPWPLKTQFVQLYLKVAFYFLSWGRNKYVTLEMRLLWKYIRKIKIGLSEVGTFSAITSEV